jgi:hypothetical protein
LLLKQELVATVDAASSRIMIGTHNDWRSQCSAAKTGAPPEMARMAHLFKTRGAQEEPRDFKRQFRAMGNTAHLYYRELPYNGNYARAMAKGLYR